LLARDPATHADLTSPGSVGSLLGALREAEAWDAVATLLARDPAVHADVDNSRGIARLLDVLSEAGAADASTALAARAADGGLSQTLSSTGRPEFRSVPFGREPDGMPSTSWSWHDLE